MLFQMAGYSGTPLEKKLGLKPNAKLALVAAPPGFALALPDGAELAGPRARDLDLIMWFVKELKKFKNDFETHKARIKPDGALWIAWPKKTSGVATDMTEDRVREVALPTGLVDNKVCAVDEIWSGLRLVWRLERRPHKA